MKTKVKNQAPPSLENRKARFRFEILETIEAGLVLVGTEVKSLRKGKGNLVEAYALVKNNELILINLHIQAYEHGNQFNHEETRTRKLLLHKKEIQHLRSSIEAKGLALVPLKLYFNHKGKVKILLGLGKGKKLFDKRESEKKADAKLEIERALRNKNK